MGGTGALVPLTLKKNYLNSIGTDSLIASDNEEGISFTSTEKTTNRYYYHTNQLGSVIAISTSTGLVVQKYSYNVYGKPYVSIGNALYALSSYTGTLYGNSRLYTGREYDRETGYYYLRARIYSPDLGRFLSRDPIGQNDQVNLYTYVRNSPLNYTDKNGKNSKPATVGNYLADFAGNLAGTIIEGGYHIADGLSFGYLDEYTGVNASMSNQLGSNKIGFKRGLGLGWQSAKETNILIDSAVSLSAIGSLATGYAKMQMLKTSSSAYTTATESFQISGKKINQLPERGWNDIKIEEAIKNPIKTAKSIDKATGEEATAFFVKDNQYVVRGNTSGKIIQGSDLGKPDWINDDIFTRLTSF